MGGHFFGARRLRSAHRRWMALPVVAALALAGALTAAPAGASPVGGSVTGTGICFGFADAGGCAAGFGGSDTAVAGSTTLLTAAFTATDGASHTVIIDGSGTGIGFPAGSSNYQVDNSATGIGCSVDSDNPFAGGQSVFVMVPAACAATSGQQLVVLVNNTVLPSTPGSFSFNLSTSEDLNVVGTNALNLISVPSAPKLRSASRGDHSITVSWSVPDSDGNSALTGYDVYCAIGTPNTSSTPVATTDADTTSTTLNGLSTHTTYSCVVTATNAAGQSDASDLLSATPDSIPGAPRNFSTTSGNGSVTILWDRPTDVGGTPITGYTAYCSTSFPPTVGAADECGEFGPAQRSGTVHGLTNNVPYYVGITATNAVGEGPMAGIGNPTPGGAPTRPWAARAKTHVGSSVVRWKVPTNDGGSPVSGYDTYCSTENPPDINSVAPAASSTNHVRISGFAAGTTYYCVVTASNGRGTSQPSPVVTIVAI
jgi:hypothetical protein